MNPNSALASIFTDHMFIMDYEKGRGWHDARVVPYGPFVMDPACTVFHYAQEIFEGMKCYRRKDGGLNLFCPRDNFERTESLCRAYGHAEDRRGGGAGGSDRTAEGRCGLGAERAGHFAVYPPDDDLDGCDAGRSRLSHLSLLHHLLSVRRVLRQGARPGRHLRRAGAGSRG